MYELESITWDELDSKLKVHNVRKPSARGYQTFVPRLSRVDVSDELSRILDNNASSRVIIDAVLKEAIKSTGHSTNIVEHPSRGEKEEGCFIIIEEDEIIVKPFKEKDVREMLGYMVSVRRENKLPVFGIISYGLYWEFYALDTAGVVYSGGAGIMLDRPPNGFQDSVGLKKVVSWIVWILDSIRDKEVNVKECFKNCGL